MTDGPDQLVEGVSMTHHPKIRRQVSRADKRQSHRRSSNHRTRRRARRTLARKMSLASSALRTYLYHAVVLKRF